MWAERNLTIDFMVSTMGDIIIDVNDEESGDQSRLSFSAEDNEDDVIHRIGEEIHSWISLMQDEMENECDEED